MPTPSRPLAAVLLVLGAVIGSFGAIQLIHGGSLNLAGAMHLVIAVVVIFAGGHVLGRAP